MPVLVDPFRFGGASLYGIAYATLTIAAGKVSADLAGHPVRVDLAHMPAAFWTAVQSDGRDIRVTRAADGVALPVDVVWINKGGQRGEIFFRADLAAAAANVFTVRAGGLGLTMPAVTDPLGRNAVWVGYGQVYALGSHSAVDRTGNGNDGTIVSYAGAPAYIEGGLDFTGSIAHIHAGIGGTYPAEFTMAAVASGPISGPNSDWLISLDNSSPGDYAANSKLQLGYRKIGEAWVVTWPTFQFYKDPVNSAASLSGVTEFYALRNTATATEMLTRGVLVGSTARREVSGGTPRFLVAHPTPETWQGPIYLAYFRRDASSLPRIKAEADSWRSPGSFYSVAAA